MRRQKNIILTGEQGVGKSTIVRKVLHEVEVDYEGIFCEAVYENTHHVGYGLRMAGKAYLDIFAHNNIKSDISLGPYRCDLEPFRRAAAVLRHWLSSPPPLMVIDEIGVIEKSVPLYHRAIVELLDSQVPCFFVVQKRAGYVWRVIDMRRDCCVYEATPDNRDRLPNVIVRNLRMLLTKNKNARRSPRSA